MLLTMFVLVAGYCSGQPQDRIIGGVSIPIEEAPWVVTYAGRGGGVIVHPKFVLAHANDTRAFIKVKGSTLNFGDGEIIMVQKRIQHPGYVKSGYLNYNCQLLLLERAIKLDKYAKVVEIGDSSLVRVGTPVTIYGWGIISIKTNKVADSLKSVTMPIAKCVADDHNKRRFCTPVVTKLWDKGLCNGDGGNAAFIGGKMVGMYVKLRFNKAYECGVLGRQDIFEITALDKDWIEETIKKYTGQGRV